MLKSIQRCFTTKDELYTIIDKYSKSGIELHKRGIIGNREKYIYLVEIAAVKEARKKLCIPAHFDDNSKLYKLGHGDISRHSVHYREYNKYFNTKTEIVCNIEVFDSIESEKKIKEICELNQWNYNYKDYKDKDGKYLVPFVEGITEFVILNEKELEILIAEYNNLSKEAMYESEIMHNNKLEAIVEKIEASLEHKTHKIELLELELEISEEKYKKYKSKLKQKKGELKEKEYEIDGKEREIKTLKFWIRDLRSKRLESVSTLSINTI